MSRGAADSLGSGCRLFLLRFCFHLFELFELLVRRTASLLFEDSVWFGPEGILPLIKVFLQMRQAEGRRLQVGLLGLHLTVGSPADAPPLLL